MTPLKHAWLRWLGVLPVAIIAYLIAYNLLRLLSLLGNLLEGNSPNGWYNLYIVPVIAAGVAGYAYINSGVSIAPLYKKETGLILVVLMALITGAALLIELGHTRIMGILELSASLVGTVIGYFSSNEEGH